MCNSVCVRGICCSYWGVAHDDLADQMLSHGVSHHPRFYVFKS